jgi:hypothetical protein
MSRSNPNKVKPRQTRETAQIVVEGFTEEAFCRHLKSMFARDCGIRVDIHNVRGGSPQDVIRAAMKREGFDRTFLMFDTDLPLSPSWAAKARAAGHIIVGSTPCIEALFLSILGETVPDRTEDCKRAFSKHLNERQKCDYRCYQGVFPRELLTDCPQPEMVLLRSVFGRLFS